MLRFIRNFLNTFSTAKSRGEVVFIQDPESQGFSAHYEKYPETFGQGATKKEALKSLDKTLAAVLRLEATDAARAANEQLKKGEKRKFQHA